MYENFLSLSQKVLALNLVLKGLSFGQLFYSCAKIDNFINEKQKVFS